MISPRVIIRKRGGEWFWELFTIIPELMTSRRFIDCGVQDTWRGAMWEADHEWALYQKRWLL